MQKADQIVIKNKDNKENVKSQSIKHFINDRSEIVTEAIRGHVALHSDVLMTLAPNYPHVVVLREVSRIQPAVICGGGSGHEPAHVGFVAPGWLSGAVCGRIFASPPSSNVTACIDYLMENGSPGVLVLVKNYTGDIINFSTAVELARARYGAGRIEMSVIGDDITFGVEHDSRRGIAGTILWYKIICGVANLFSSFFISSDDEKKSESKSFLPDSFSSGDSPLPFVIVSIQLKVLTSVARAVSLSLRSMGASISTCTIPGQAELVKSGIVKENSANNIDHIELGLGIHGEKGSEAKTFENADSLVKELLERIFNPIEKIEKEEELSEKNNLIDKNKKNYWPFLTKFENKHDDSSISNKNNIAIFLNNLGGTSLIEMSLLTNSLFKELITNQFDNSTEKKNSNSFVIRAFGSGAACTSLNMHGFSITVFNIDLFLQKMFEEEKKIAEMVSSCLNEIKYRDEITRKSNSFFIENFTNIFKGVFSEIESTTEVLLLNHPLPLCNLYTFDKNSISGCPAIIVKKIKNLFHSSLVPPFVLFPIKESSNNFLYSEDLNKNSQKEIERIFFSELSSENNIILTKLKKILHFLINRESLYNEYDTMVGDGDTGTGLRNACVALIDSDDLMQLSATMSYRPIKTFNSLMQLRQTECNELSVESFNLSENALLEYINKSEDQSTAHLGKAMHQVARIIADEFGGTMGALLASFLSGFAEGWMLAFYQSMLILYKNAAPDDKSESRCPSYVEGLLLPSVLRNAIIAGLRAVQRVGGAKAGDRTFVDVLLSMSDVLDEMPPLVTRDISEHCHLKHELMEASDTTSESSFNFKLFFLNYKEIFQWLSSDVVKNTRKSAESVKLMRAKKGRARYLGGREIGFKDPGCEIVADIFEYTTSFLKSNT